MKPPVGRSREGTTNTTSLGHHRSTIQKRSRNLQSESHKLVQLSLAALLFNQAFSMTDPESALLGHPSNHHRTRSQTEQRTFPLVQVPVIAPSCTILDRKTRQHFQQASPTQGNSRLQIFTSW